MFLTPNLVAAAGQQLMQSLSGINSTFIWQQSIEWTWWAWSILNLSLNLSVYRFAIGTFLASTCRLSKASFWTMDFILSFFVGCRGGASMTRSRSIRRCATTGTAYQVWYCRRSGWIPAVKGARMRSRHRPWMSMVGFHVELVTCFFATTSDCSSLWSAWCLSDCSIWCHVYQLQPCTGPWGLLTFHHLRCE